MTSTTTTTIRPENEKAARTWGAGGDAYDRISRQIGDAIAHAVDRLDPQPGQRVADVATGTGWGARLMAACGAEVTASDLSEEVVEAARTRGSENIDYHAADAEALPYDDAAFDGVISTFGVMFCAEPERAAAELARVTRPGGRLALATWTPDGAIREMFKVIVGHMPAPPTAASPFAWGDTERLVELLGDDFDLGFEEATVYYRDRDGAAAWDAFSTGYGPVKALAGVLDDEARERFRDDFVALYERYRTGAGILIPREYVITVGTRRGA
jgi:SAM-dependent methyltransferase